MLFMKFITLIFFSCLCHLSLTAQSTAKTVIGGEMADILENTKAYTMALLKQMPEDRWDYRPHPAVRTFREQVEHIVTVLDFQTNFVLARYDFKGEIDQLRKVFGEVAARNNGKSRTELLARLEHNYAVAAKVCRELSKKDLRKTFNFFFFPDQPTKSLATAMLAMRDHITHHRGQLIIYLRMLDIEPTTYQAF